MRHVDRMLHRLALGDRRLGEILAAAQLFQNARALVFAFELFEGLLDVFALLYRHDNHNYLRIFNVLRIDFASRGIHSASAGLRKVCVTRRSASSVPRSEDKDAVCLPPRVSVCRLRSSLPGYSNLLSIVFVSKSSEASAGRCRDAPPALSELQS